MGLPDRDAQSLAGVVWRNGAAKEKLATNSPQSETEPQREVRKTAGYRGQWFCGKSGLVQLFCFRNPHLSICFSYGASDGTCDLFRDREKAAYMRPLPRHNSRRSVMTRSTSRRWSSSETYPAPPVPVGRNCPGPYMAGCVQVFGRWQ